ncbi:helix-turn-helix domain-containing protein [Aquabacter sp. P-9]|uniref:helix-turn-helix domain-containing protein n=1 Tax=Aquabacter sediminis TaxID=3029197 RepID=UPI00237E9937|nr:short-chain fatty acyl-CoA regulator family protein [Aquabacter sp. P-9]MDE1567321.1 short-chain fatty acyl-CoA regulator family protein [Aquabacter sp. P-9]
MRQKVFAGHALRRLREKLGLKQGELAHRLGVSPSYVNQMESNQRPLTASVLIAISRTFGVDITSFGAEDLDRLVADLREATADPLFRDLELSLQDLKAVTNLSPAFAHAFLRMHVALGRTAEWRASLDDMLTSGLGTADAKLVPYEEVRDYFHYIDNYVDPLDRAAEACAEALGILSGADPRAALTAYLRDRLRVEVEPLPLGRSASGGDEALSQFDPRARRLRLSPLLSPAAAAFQLGTTIARLEHKAMVDGLVANGGFRSATAGEICRLALHNYFAGALVLPYGRFLRLARERRHDLDRLSHETGASLEQVCHRLSTLQRAGLKGVPFYFAKVDRAGNITKRHSATRFQFARLGGACAVWNVHQAFENPGRTLVQVGEMPDGVRYLCLARTVSAPVTRHDAPQRVYALGLGCEVSYGDDMVYADGLDLKAAPVARLGVSCRICPRPDCDLRAFPPLDREIRTDPDNRAVVPFTFT